MVLWRMFNPSVKSDFINLEPPCTKPFNYVLIACTYLLGLLGSHPSSVVDLLVHYLDHRGRPACKQKHFNKLIWNCIKYLYNGRCVYFFLKHKMDYVIGKVKTVIYHISLKKKLLLEVFSSLEYRVYCTLTYLTL